MNRCLALTDLSDEFVRLAAAASFAPDDEDSADNDDPSLDDPDLAPDAGEGDDADDDNPRVKQLSDEAAKHRRLKRAAVQRAEAAEARVAELEKQIGATDTGALAEENRTLRLRLAFERASHTAKLHDVEAAWTLVQEDLKGVKVEKGEVDTDRIGQIVGHVVERYPYLVGSGEEDTGPGDVFPLTQPSGPAPTSRSRPGQATDFATLAKKFPALRR